MKKVLLLIAILTMCMTFSACNKGAGSGAAAASEEPVEAFENAVTYENAQVEVQLYRYGVAQDGEVTYTVCRDMLDGGHTGKAVLKPPSRTANSGPFPSIPLRVVKIGDKFSKLLKNNYLCSRNY